ncbi:MAG: LysR family transcriptional regulator [Cytophagaceae bacterium]|jgi:DNA-binding transcriptional LysR family regulator|nr:LysR family transcriptional regulator [Cytophagaceae bacterium]
MNYTFHQLSVFLKVVETKSITKAAEELFLTQPAVSIQLKNFQDQFEIPLTEVVGRQLYVTDFGNEIAEAAQAILDQLQTIQYKTSAYKGLLTGRLKISIVSTGKYVMPYFLQPFLHHHPGIDLTMDVTNKSKVIESLERNEVDFSLVSIVPEHLSIEKIDLLQNKLYLVGKNMPSEKKELYDRSIIKQLPMIYREIGSGTRQTMEGFIDRYQIKPLKKIELTTNEAVKQAIMAGMGYSIMPLIGIKNELIRKDVRIIPVKGLPIRTTWSLIWLKGKKHRPESLAYIKFLKGNNQEIINNTFEWFEKY